MKYKGRVVATCASWEDAEASGSGRGDSSEAGVGLGSGEKVVTLTCDGGKES